MKPIMIVAGCGPPGRAIAERCASRWRVTVIDVDETKLELLPSLEISGVAGDCTSTLVLKSTPIAMANAVVAATGSDEVNFEFCLLARRLYGVKNVVALLKQEEEERRFQEADFKTVTRPGSAAAIVESHLNSATRTATDIGLGLGEIVEVSVQGHSPVIGKSLRILRPKSWLLAAIYRGGSLIVPHGDTKIEENDRCLLTGDPAILPDIAQYFQRGASEFPLQFGTRYGVLDWDCPEVLEEAHYLLDHTMATGMHLLVRSERSMTAAGKASVGGNKPVATYQLDDAWPDNLEEVSDHLDLAAHLISAKPLSWSQRRGLSRGSAYLILERTSRPVLICRGTHPYQRILLAVSPGPGALRMAEFAVDVARKLRATLTAAVVCASDHASATQVRQEAGETLEGVVGLAALQGLTVRTELLEGRQTVEICRAAGEFDLLMITHRRGRRFALLRPDPSIVIAGESPVTTLVLPYTPDDLANPSANGDKTVPV